MFKRPKQLTLQIFAILVVLNSFSNACEPPDCDRNDCGTCANACCNLNFFLQPDPVSLNRMLSASLTLGGPDQHYTFVAADDLRQYNISAYFILQGVHTTFVKKYNDTLNFVIYPVNTSRFYRSSLSAFSISQIHGAFCDDGQNYKNLVQLVKGLNVDYVEQHVAGCPPNPKN